MKSIFYSYLIIVVVLSGCSSGKSTFERGNYYEAVITAVNRLRRNNDHKKSVETLRQAYPMAVSFFEDKARISLSSSERFKWSEVVRSYTAINTMYDEIKRCPGALAVIPDPVNYFSKLQEAKQNAAEENYAAGILALQTGTRDDAKQAYAYFRITNEYVPGYKEVKDYLDAALAAATVKIVVEPIPVHSKSVGVSAEFFNDKISEFVHSASINEFVRFYTRAEAQKIKLSPDHIVQLQFDEFTVGEVYKHEKEIQLVKDSVVMGTYVTSGAANQPANNHQTTPRNGSGLVTASQSPVLNTGKKPTSNNSSPASPANDQNTETDREKAARELAEKQRLEQEARDRALAERLKAEKDAAEKERVAREAAEKAANEAAEKERKAREAAEAERRAKEAEKALADKTLTEKQAAENARIEREKAEKEKAEHERIEKERADKEQGEKVKAEKEKSDKEQAEKIKAEKEKAEKEHAEKIKAEKEKAEKEEAEKKVKAEKEKAEREQAEKVKAEKEKAEKEQAEKIKAEKEKADRERDEKEKAAKAHTGKAKYEDPTIQSEDTLNVTDPVLICHIPPGNKANTRTLRINRTALKAHLAHGDIEGGCESEKEKQKADPGGVEKGKEPDEQKAQPHDDKKVKGGKGSAKIKSEDRGYSLALTHNAVLIASREGNPVDMLRYLEFSTVATDTNKVYGSVKATLYHYTKTTVSKGIVSFRIIDAKTGALLSVQKMPGEFVWKSEWATFNGDERALSSEQLTLTKLKEQPAPAPQQLFIEFTRPIYDQITTKLKEFYKAY